VLAVAVGTEAAFVAVAAVSLVLALAVAATRAPGIEAERGSPLPLLGDPEIRRSGTLVAFQSTLFAMLVTFVPVVLTEIGSKGAVAPTFLAAALVALVVNPLVGVWSDRHGAVTLVRLGLAIAPLLLIGLGLAQGTAAIVALTVAYFGVVWNLIEVSAVTALTGAAERLGETVAGSVLVMTTIAAGELVGALAAGGVGSTLGRGPTFVIGAFVLIGIALAHWRPVR
jgi:hypothetical protein